LLSIIGGFNLLGNNGELKSVYQGKFEGGYAILNSRLFLSFEGESKRGEAPLL